MMELNPAVRADFPTTDFFYLFTNFFYQSLQEYDRESKNARYIV